MGDLEDVRRRPSAYIGNTDDGSGLHRMLFAVVDNPINEAFAGHCSRIEVALNAGGSATLRDDGRGIPIEIHPRESISAAEVIMTHLGTAEGFPQSTPKPPHAFPIGVGLAAVNALSELLELRVWRNGKQYFIRYRAGQRESPIPRSAQRKGQMVNGAAAELRSCFVRAARSS